MTQQTMMVSNLYSFLDFNTSMQDLVIAAKGFTVVPEEKAEEIVKEADRLAQVRVKIKEYCKPILEAVSAPHRRKEADTDYLYIGHREGNRLILNAVAVGKEPSEGACKMPNCVIDADGLLVFYVRRTHEHNSLPRWNINLHLGEVDLYGKLFEPEGSFVAKLP